MIYNEELADAFWANSFWSLLGSILTRLIKKNRLCLSLSYLSQKVLSQKVFKAVIMKSFHIDLKSEEIEKKNEWK